MPVSEDLICYPPLLELSFKKNIYESIQIIIVENFYSEHFNILENFIVLKNYRILVNA